jgi:hypothetical protein
MALTGLRMTPTPIPTRSNEVIHISREHRIVLDGTPEIVFPMFTPEGEELWVEGWAPDYLHPAGVRATSQDMVFRTRHGGEETLWSCVKWDPDAGEVRYARVTPGSRMGFVDVACRTLPQGGSEVVVRYSLTALSEAGAALLAELDQERFAAMIEGWRVKVASVLIAA